eukprot:gene15517-32794_t
MLNYYQRSQFGLLVITLLAHFIFCKLHEKIIKIGGIFSPFNANYKKDFADIQGLEAFSIAIREINGRTDILPNHILNFTFRGPIDFFDTTQSIVDIQKYDFNSTGVDAFVLGVPKEPTIGVNYVINERYKKVYITTTTGDVRLSQSKTSMYKLRTVPSDSFNGMILQDLITTGFKYKKVSVFYSYDETSLRTSMETGDDVFGEMIQLSSHAFQVNTLDLTEHINAAKNVGSQIFIICAEAQTGARLLEQGYNMGLFKEGTQIFGSALLTQSKPWKY